MQPPTEIQGYFSDFGAPPEDIKILLLNPNGHAHERRSMLLEPEVLKFPQDLDDHVIGDRKPKAFLVSSTLIAAACPGLVALAAHVSKYTRADKIPTICFENFDIDVFILMLRILQHMTDSLLNIEMSVEILLRLATLTQWFDCQSAVSFYVRVWSSQLPWNNTQSITSSISSLWLSFVYRDALYDAKGAFSFASRYLITNLESPLVPQPGLPFSQRVADTINQRRIGGIERLLSIMWMGAETSYSPDTGMECCGCSMSAKKCQSKFSKGMRKLVEKSNLFHGAINRPYNNLSIAKLLKLLQEDSSQFGPKLRGCRISTRLKTSLADVEELLLGSGLYMDDFPPEPKPYRARVSDIYCFPQPCLVVT